MSTLIRRKKIWREQKHEHFLAVILPLIKKVEAGGVHLGVWDCPPEKQETFTRREFIRHGLDRGLLTELEASELRSDWATIIDRDLSD